MAYVRRTMSCCLTHDIVRDLRHRRWQESRRFLFFLNYNLSFSLFYHYYHYLMDHNYFKYFNHDRQIVCFKACGQASVSSNNASLDGHELLRQHWSDQRSIIFNGCIIFLHSFYYLYNCFSLFWQPSTQLATNWQVIDPLNLNFSTVTWTSMV